MEIRLERLPEGTVFGRKGRARTAALDAFIGESRSAPLLHAEALGAKRAGPVIVLSHGDVDHEKDGPVEVCLPVRAEAAADDLKHPAAVTAMVAEAGGGRIVIFRQFSRSTARPWNGSAPKA